MEFLSSVVRCSGVSCDGSGTGRLGVDDSRLVMSKDGSTYCFEGAFVWLSGFVGSSAIVWSSVMTVGFAHATSVVANNASMIAIIVILRFLMGSLLFLRTFLRFG